MLGIFKTKRTISSVACLFASRMPQLLSDEFDDDALHLQFQRLITKGANESRVHPEIAAFHCFLVWVGISVARQRKKITESNFDRLLTAYFANLEELSAEIDVFQSGSFSYSSFWDYLMSRIDRYVSIATTITSEREGVEMIIDNVCDFLCDVPPSAEIKLELLSVYVLSSGRVLDILMGTRLE